MARRGIGLLLGVAVGFLTLVGVGASATHYLQEPYNPGFLEYPTIVALHVVLGGVYLGLAPFQFVKRIRSRHLGHHQWAGRLLVAIGLVVGATALFMGLVVPFSGWPEGVIIGLFGVLFLLALGKGFLHIRAGRAGLHREWMIRAFAIGLSIATMRLIFRPRADHRGHAHQRADRDALDLVVRGGVRRARLRDGSLAPGHPQERRSQGRRGERCMKARKRRATLSTDGAVGSGSG